MRVSELFQHIEESIATRSRAAGIVQHAGDRGGAREALLREFLGQHLPAKYGVTKGEVVTKVGVHSHSADVIIYDAINSPALYLGDTRVLPIEGVYGVIEVKSALSKAVLIAAVRQIEAFKRMAPRDLSVIQTREYVTVLRPSRPFGAVLAFDLERNSLESLSSNWIEVNQGIHDVNYFTNLIAVLGSGLIHYEMVDWSNGQIGPLLDTDQFVNFLLTQQKRASSKEPQLDSDIRVAIEPLTDATFGRFFVYLLMMLERLKLGVPDLGQYFDPGLPLMVHRES